MIHVPSKQMQELVKENNEMSHLYEQITEAVGTLPEVGEYDGTKEFVNPRQAEELAESRRKSISR